MSPSSKSDSKQTFPWLVSKIPNETSNYKQKINNKVKKSFEELPVKKYFKEVSKLFQENDNIVFINYDEIGVFLEISQDKTLEIEGTNHVKL